MTGHLDRRPPRQTPDHPATLGSDGAADRRLWRLPGSQTRRSPRPQGPLGRNAKSQSVCHRHRRHQTGVHFVRLTLWVIGCVSNPSAGIPGQLPTMRLPLPHPYILWPPREISLSLLDVVFMPKHQCHQGEKYSLMVRASGEVFFKQPLHSVRFKQPSRPHSLPAQDLPSVFP